MKLNPMIVLREDFDDVAVLFNPDDGTILQLNKTALFIVKKLEKGATMEEIINGLKAACGESFKDSSHAEVEGFIAKLKKVGYVQD